MFPCILGRCGYQVFSNIISPNFCRNVLYTRRIPGLSLRHIYRGKGGGISVLISLQNAETFVGSLQAKERELLKEALSKNERLADEGKRHSQSPCNLHFYIFIVYLKIV